jgi:hypothetical protein
MFAHDCIDGRMERESMSILCVIKAVAQTKEATFSTHGYFPNGTNVLFSRQNVIDSTDYPLSYSHNVFRLQSNQFPHGDSVRISLLIPDINNDLRLAVSKKSLRDTEVSKRPFCPYNEGNLEIIIAREVKRIHRLVSVRIWERLLVSFGLNPVIESFDFTIRAFDELSREFRSSSELVLIGFPGFEQKVQFHLGMWRTVSYVLLESRGIPAKLLLFDFHWQKRFEFRL